MAAPSSAAVAGFRARFGTVMDTLRTDLGGAALLVVATVVAMIWANLPLEFGYSDFWATELTLGVGGAELELNLHELVNSGLMTFFFFVVGLEVKRDLVLGELADPRRRTVPLVAAVTGMLVPAAIYLAITWGTDAQGGWGTVISTDTAFVLGVLVLLGRACPPQLRILIMALAVADDVGALSVIAVCYTSELHLGYLLAAVAGVGLMFVLRRLRVWRGPAYFVIGVASWIALFLSGVEPTLLGVAVAFATETYANRRDHIAAAAQRTQAYVQSPSSEAARSAQISLQRAVPVNERLLTLWQPWTTVVIVPLFALANAGISLSGDQLAQAVRSPVTLGIVAGLVVGKTVGIFMGVEMAVRFRWGSLAPDLSRLHILGGAAVAGMGFTISLFIVGLAFGSPDQANDARIGILAASVLAALLGTVLLKLAAHRHPPPPVPVTLEPPVDVEADHVRGRPDAPVTLVEYGDYESPESHGAHWAVREVQDLLPGQVRFVFRHRAGADAGPNASLAAEAAEAAGAQGRFWEMHDELFGTAAAPTGDHLGLGDLLGKAAAIGLDQAAFAADLGTGRFADRVRSDAASARASGVERSPAFFIDGTRYRGPHDAHSLIDALRASSPELVPAVAGPVDRRTSPVLPPWRAGQVPGRDGAEELARDLPETPDHGGVLARLSEEALGLLAEEGNVEDMPDGQILFDVGQAVDDLLVILSGAVAIVEYARQATPEVSVHERGRFLGEVDLLTHQVSSRRAVAVRAGQILRLTPAQQQAAFRRDPALRESIVRTVLLRRAGLLEVPDLRMIGAPEAAATRALVEWADAHQRSYSIEDAATLGPGDDLAALGLSAADLPAVFTRTGELLKNPRPEEVARALADRSPRGQKPKPHKER